MKTNLLLTVACLGLTCTAVAADPWADNIVNYTPGTGVPSVFGSDPPILFDQDSAALGAPTRDSVGFGGFAVSPYGAAADVSEVVSLGDGGSITVSFDEPVTNDTDNPYGIDLLIFSNAFFTTNDFNFDAATTNTGLTGETGGIVEISSDGVNFTEVTGALAEGYFPTNGYTDAVGHFPAAGSVLADFLLPVNPSFDPTGLTAAQTYAGYGGSGGGTGIDIGAFGFSEISFVRVTNPIGSGVTPEIDAFADVAAVPEPTSLLILLAALPFVAAKRN